MGLSHVEAELRAALLSPRVSEAMKLEPGHRRGQTAPRADRTDSALRGIPVIGHGAGAISNTSPGGELGAAARLERTAKDLNAMGQEIVRRRMRAARGRAPSRP